MMKRVMMLAVAALAVCTAQAVTLSWQTGASDSVYEGKGLPSSGTSTSAKAASFAILVTANATAFSSAMGTIADIGLWDSGHLYAYMYGPGNGLNGHIGVEKKGNGGEGWGTSSTTPVLSVGEQYVLAFTIVRNDNNTISVAGYANGTQLFSLTTDSQAQDMAVATFANDAYWTIGETAAYDGVLTAEELASLYANKTAVLLPEPTVLALLALGVAGLALRRRAA